MASEPSTAEKRTAHLIRVWAVVRVVPAPPSRKEGGVSATRTVGFHMTEASAREDQDRRGGPPGDETEGFDVQPATLLTAWESGAFSLEEVRRKIEQETGALERDERIRAMRTPLWTVWYEDRFGYGEDRDPPVVHAHFFTREEAEAEAAKNGGPPTAEAFAGYSVSGGSVFDARAAGILETNDQVRELLEKMPPEIEERMLERVCAFVAKETGVKRAGLLPETAIVDDLGIKGREGARLMAEFFAAFDVNPHGFEVTRYFSPETMGILGSISSIMRSDPPRMPLTIDDLVGVAMVGRWVAFD